MESNMFLVRVVTSICTLSIASALLVGCSSSNSGGDEGYTITAIGGTGGEDGGRGGSFSGSGLNDLQFSISKRYGNGNIEILKTGSVDIDITITPVETNLGDVPLEITSDQIIIYSLIEPPVGAIYSDLADLSRLYVSDGNEIVADEAVVTGISIAAKTVLTLSPGPETPSSIFLGADLLNNGSIVIAPESNSHLSMEMDNYIGGIGSLVTTEGSNDQGTGGNITITALGSVLNQGEINANGGGGINTGSSGVIDISANTNIQNSGLISSRGGDSNDGSGGSSAGIELSTDVGVIHNSGNLVANGGDGVRGGHSGGIGVYAEAGLLNSGDLSARGGSSTGGNAGNGDFITLSTKGGGLANSGSLSTQGGNIAEVLFDAGDAGDIRIIILGNVDSELGSIQLSGDINASGGNAHVAGTGDGGNSGAVIIQLSNNATFAGNESIKLLGYNRIDMSGGDASQPGDAGNVRLKLSSGYKPLVQNGNIINEANIFTVGGNVIQNSSAVSSGGLGGAVVFETRDDTSLIDVVDSMLENITNSGNINSSAGVGFNTANEGARSGGIGFNVNSSIINTGNLTSNGSSDSSDSGIGGISSGIYFYAAFNDIVNSGSLSANGGDGASQGGNATGISMRGVAIDNSGDLTANGGNAKVDLNGSSGGLGGCSSLIASDGLNESINNTGTISYAGGTGDTKGSEGAIIINDELTGNADLCGPS